MTNLHISDNNEKMVSHFKHKFQRKERKNLTRAFLYFRKSFFSLITIQIQFNFDKIKLEKKVVSDLNMVLPIREWKIAFRVGKVLSGLTTFLPIL